MNEMILTWQTDRERAPQIVILFVVQHHNLEKSQKLSDAAIAFCTIKLEPILEMG